MNQRERRNLLIGVVAIALVVGVSLWYRHHQHQRQHDEDHSGANRPAEPTKGGDVIKGGAKAKSTLEPKRTFPQFQLTFLEMNCGPNLDAPPLEYSIGGQSFSLLSLYAKVGIDLQVSKSPAFSSVKNVHCPQVSEADADSMLLDYFKRVPYDEHHLVALLASSELNGGSDLGLMFEKLKDDPMPRQAFAIFVEKNRAMHPNTPSEVPGELLLTTAHELTHCFNLHHCDYDLDSDGKQTIEGTNIALQPFSWSFSEGTKKHFAEDPLDEVLPGKGHWPFLKVTCEHRSRHQRSAPDDLAIVDQYDCARTTQLGEAKGLDLEVRAASPDVVLGDPVFLTLGLHNDSSAARRVFSSLAPEYGMLSLEIKQPSGKEFVSFAPILIRETQGFPSTDLAAGGSIHVTTQVSYDTNGWVFQKPGDYELRANLLVPDGAASDQQQDFARVSSRVTTIRVAEPRTDAERLAQRAFTGQEQGMFLALQGSDHLSQAFNDLSKLVAKAPASRQTAIARLLLVNALVHPTLDLRTGVRPPPRVREAQALLSGMGSGQGLPALLAFKTYNDLADALLRSGRSHEAYTIRSEAISKFGKDEAVRRPPLPNSPLSSNESVHHGPATIGHHWSGNAYPKFIPADVPYYVVVVGDSLWGISQRLYNDPMYWETLQTLNSFIRNPNLLYPGDPILLPADVTSSQSR
jgi:hypothetical protein